MAAAARPESRLAEDLFTEHSRLIYAYCLRRLGSPEERTAHVHMSTYGPDLNLSCSDLDEAGEQLGHWPNAERLRKAAAGYPKR